MISSSIFQKKCMKHLICLILLGISMLKPTQLQSMERSVQRFKDQVVVVTGASKGIGKAIANRFAEEGAYVVLVARNEEQLSHVQQAIQEQGHKAICMSGDVADKARMEAIVQEIIDQFGKIDILCHNAGIYPTVRLEEMALDEWRHVLDVNLTGTFIAVKACISSMKDQGRGKIIVTSSISGPQTGLPGYSHYTASKGGIAGFIKTAAIELAKYHININAVEPGNIMTEGFDVMGQGHIENMVKAIPMGRLGTPDDVAYAVMFLASKEADYITGQSIIIDGGQTLPESHHSPY